MAVDRRDDDVLFAEQLRHLLLIGRTVRIHADVSVRFLEPIEPVNILARKLSQLNRFIHHEVVIIIEERISANFAALICNVDIRLKNIAQYTRDPIVLNAL